MPEEGPDFDGPPSNLLAAADRIPGTAPLFNFLHRILHISSQFPEVTLEEVALAYQGLLETAEKGAEGATKAPTAVTASVTAKRVVREVLLHWLWVASGSPLVTISQFKPACNALAEALSFAIAPPATAVDATSADLGQAQNTSQWHEASLTRQARFKIPQADPSFSLQASLRSACHTSGALSFSKAAFALLKALSDMLSDGPSSSSCPNLANILSQVSTLALEVGGGEYGSGQYDPGLHLEGGEGAGLQPEPDDTPQDLPSGGVEDGGGFGDVKGEGDLWEEVPTLDGAPTSEEEALGALTTIVRYIVANGSNFAGACISEMFTGEREPGGGEDLMAQAVAAQQVMRFVAELGSGTGLTAELFCLAGDQPTDAAILSAKVNSTFISWSGLCLVFWGGVSTTLPGFGLNRKLVVWAGLCVWVCGWMGGSEFKFGKPIHLKT